MNSYLRKEIINDSDFVKLYDKCCYINCVKNIKAKRMNLNYTQEQISEMCDLSRIGYSNIEKGISVPSIISMRSIVRNLNITLDSAWLDYIGETKNISHLSIDDIELERNRTRSDIQKITVTVINRLIDEYTKPEDQQDISSIIIWCAFLNKLFDLKSNPKNLRKIYPSSMETFEKYVVDLCEKYSEIITNDEIEISTKKQSPRRMVLKQVKNIAVAVLMIFGIVFAAQVVVYALGYDLFSIISEWTESILNAPYDTEITNDNTTIIKSKDKSYANIEEAVKDLGIGLLYPTYLPDGNTLDLISDLSTPERLSLLYRFNKAGVGFAVHSYTNDAMNLVETENIGGYDCLVSENPDNGRIQVNFVYDDMLYTISCIEYDELVKVVEGLSYFVYQ